MHYGLKVDHRNEMINFMLIKPGNNEQLDFY